MGDVIGDLNARRGRVQSMERAGQRPGDQRRGAAGGDVRLRDRPAVDDPGSGDLHDAVRAATSRCPKSVGEEIVAKAVGAS